MKDATIKGIIILNNIFVNEDKGRNKMIEIKIRFKSGNVGYFKLIEDPECNIERILKGLRAVMENTHVGSMILTDLEDNKETIINVKEIESFGYKNVDGKGSV